MLEEVVADASIPVDAEADEEEKEDFRRFLDRTSPAELIRNLQKAQPEPDEPEAGEPESDEPEPGDSGDDGPGPA
jgi:hypothetical protein